jgi:hypothetical protein
MPRTITFRLEGAHFDFSGVVTGDDLFGVNEVFLGHDYPGTPRYALMDFTGAARVDLSAEDLKKVAAEDERDADRLAGVAIVIVAPQTLTYGLARVWEGLTDPASLDSQVVRTRAEAVRCTRAEAVRWLTARGIDVEA